MGLCPSVLKGTRAYFQRLKTVRKYKGKNQNPHPEEILYMLMHCFRASFRRAVGCLGPPCYVSAREVQCHGFPTPPGSCLSLLRLLQQSTGLGRKCEIRCRRAWVPGKSPARGCVLTWPFLGECTRREREISCLLVDRFF